MIKLPFNIKLGLSRRKKIPVFYMFEKTFLPHQLLSLLARIKWLKIVNKDEESVIIDLYDQQIKLLNDFFVILATEWKTWEKYYLPAFSLSEKTVLDVGAGCGETAFFYLLYGARKVVAIEPDRRASECLKENAKRNNWNVEIIPEAFKLEHLKIPHDFMKMDIEGYEKELLKASITKPCIVEVHSNELRRKLEEKGFQRTYTSKKDKHLIFFTPKSEACK
jgi:SAM-dependent methyltransferase